MIVVDDWPYWLSLAVVGFLLIKTLYWRLPVGMAYIRDGLGGQKVILNKGGFVFPGLQVVSSVSLENFTVQVYAEHEKSLWSRDPFRIDINIRLLVRVTPTLEGITLARNIVNNDTNKVIPLLEERARPVLQDVLSNLKFVDISGHPTDFEHALYASLEQELSKLGFTLVLVSLVEMKQTDQSYYHRNNSLDAEALTKLEILQNKNDQLLQAGWRSAELEIEALNREASLKELEWETSFVDAKLMHQRHRAEMEARIRQDIQEIEVSQALAAEMVQQDLDRVREQCLIEKNSAAATV